MALLLGLDQACGLCCHSEVEVSNGGSVCQVNLNAFSPMAFPQGHDLLTYSNSHTAKLICQDLLLWGPKPVKLPDHHQRQLLDTKETANYLGIFAEKPNASSELRFCKEIIPYALNYASFRVHSCINKYYECKRRLYQVNI
jgi:hypothetical protein